jgi:hypothetical protein
MFDQIVEKLILEIHISLRRTHKYYNNVTNAYNNKKKLLYAFFIGILLIYMKFLFWENRYEKIISCFNNFTRDTIN